MNNNILNLDRQIKENIQLLIEKFRLEEAEVLVNEYLKAIIDDAELISMKGIIYFLQEKIDMAEAVLKEGLIKYESSFDLNYNLAYILEQKGEYKSALEYYDLARINCSDKELKKAIEENITKIKLENNIKDIKSKKIAVFVKQGMDSFLQDIINGLSADYKVKKIIVSNYQDIDQGMEWADICWFEWCDELLEYGSKHKLASTKKIICRIHGYEVYSDLIRKPQWRYVDDLILVAPHRKKLFIENTKDLNLGNLRTHIIYCGVNTEKYPLINKKKGYTLGYLGYINYRKNLPLTLQIFRELYDKDKRYKLYIAGTFQDLRSFEYIKYFIQENNLKDNVLIDGWKSTKEIREYFKKIDYMVISSLDEGLCYAAAEAMCSGIKPILHNCEGFKAHYDRKYLFNTINEAVHMIESEEYNSLEYREYIENKFSLVEELQKIHKIIDNY